jgi:uncharacterized membrane protein YfcA
VTTNDRCNPNGSRALLHRNAPRRRRGWRRGFAFGLIASAIWLHIIPPAQSAPLIAAFAVIIQGATLWRLRHAVQISRLLPFIAGGAVGIPLGALHSTGCLRITCGRYRCGAHCLQHLQPLRPTLPAVEGGAIADSIVGLLSGAFSGSTGLAAFQSSSGQAFVAGQRMTSAQFSSPSLLPYS